MAKKKKSSNSKKGPKAWGKNLYGESDHQDHDCDKEHPKKSHKEWEKGNVEEVEEKTEEATHTTDLNPHQDNDAAGVRTVKLAEKKGKKIRI